MAKAVKKEYDEVLKGMASEIFSRWSKCRNYTLFNRTDARNLREAAKTLASQREQIANLTKTVETLKASNRELESLGWDADRHWTVSRLGH